MDQIAEIYGLNNNEISITEEIINNWEKILKNDISSKDTKIISEKINIDDYNLNFPDEKIIIDDCNRTKINEGNLEENFEENLKKILIFYCKLNEIKYKQGLNEILAPFLLLKSKINISLNRIFNLFSYFIDNFFNNFYYDNEIYSFKICFSLLNLLLKYHDPNIFNLFEINGISSDLYSTNFLLTTNCNKNDLKITYLLWNFLIEEQNKLFIFYLIIAILKYKKNEFVNFDQTNLLSYFGKIKIKNKDELNDIINLSKIIKNNTPKSFEILVEKLEIFKPKSLYLKYNYEFYNIETLLTLPLLPNDILYYIYKNKEVFCCDKNCKNFSLFTKENFENEIECKFCKNKSKEEEKINFYFIDLRILENDNKNNNQIGSILNLNNFFNQNELNNSNFLEISANLFDKIIEKKDLFHIVLIPTKTDNFNEYERQFNIEKEKYSINFNKEIFFKHLLKLNENNNNLKQYLIIKNIIQLLIQSNFPFVSYVFGGFKEIHNLILLNNLTFNEHNKNKCFLCKENQKNFYEIENSEEYYKNKIKNNVINNSYDKNMEKNLLEKKDNFISPIDKIKIENFNNFLTNKNNKVFHCFLIWHNMNIINEKIIIIIFPEIIKLFIFNNKNKNEICFDLIEDINFINIIELKRYKNIFNLIYTLNKKNHDIKIDLFTDKDSDFFELSLKDKIQNE